MAPLAWAAGPGTPEGCPGLIAAAPPLVLQAALTQDEVALTFVGHATFLIETPQGIRIATDYNDYVRPAAPPQIATMNKAHSTHFSRAPDPGIPHVLRGWNPSGGPAHHDLTVGDVRVRNVPTNIRDYAGGTEFDGNSIFVFETTQLCIAHLGHLHHTLSSAIVGAVQPSIRSREIELARRKRPENLDAYDCVMRALPAVWSSDREGVAEGLRLLEQAVSLDPGYALAKALASWCHAQQVVYLRSLDPSSDRQRAVELAEQAACLDSDDPLVLTALSAAYTLTRRHDLAAPPIERALVIDPNCAWAWQRSS
jgi:hypothetical protein